MTASADTIAAIATPPGRGAVAIVRLSGPDAFPIASRLVGRNLPATGRVAFARFAYGGRTLDEGVVLAFASPRSYTGEDVVEFQTHGGAVAPRRVLDALLECGARTARRGEFTERAFLNGKIDFEVAEGVIDLIDAKTSRAADDALACLAGEKKRAALGLYRAAVDISVEAEYAMDVDEGALPAGFAQSLSRKAADLAGAMERLLKTERSSRILRDGATIVLAGPPNSGKSSLMNALLGENRAIVSDAPGTTRDSIESWIEMDGFPVRLVDTAGVRDTDCAIEAEGVKRALAAAAAADIVLDLSPDAPARASEKVLAVHAKCDISRGDGLNVSSLTREGLDALRSEIVRRLETLSPASSRESGLADVLARAVPVLKGADAGDLVLFGNAVRTVATLLGEATGAVYSDDMLERLFSRFCVGK